MTTTPSCYRDTSRPAREELARKLTVRHREIADVWELGPLHARRVARIAGGAAMTATMVVVFALAIAAVPFEHLLPGARDGQPGPLTQLLLASWAIGAVAYRFGRAIASWRFRRRLRALAQTAAPDAGDPFLALALIDAEPVPVDAVRARLDRLAVASVAWPMVAVCLASPLTLHFLVQLPFWLAGSRPVGTDELPIFPTHVPFEEWISVSVIIVGHAHLVLAGCAVRFARSLRKRVPETASEGTWRAMSWAVGACALPGALLLLVPPIVGLVTGLAFVPLVFGWARRTYVRELVETTEGTNRQDAKA